MENAKCKMCDARYRIQDAGNHEIPRDRHKTRNQRIENRKQISKIA